MSSFRCGTATARGQASLGGSSTRVGRPGRKEPGTPEGVPRTTAITRHRGHKKSACDEDWALLRLSIPTGQGRIADASATEGIYPYGAAFARVRVLFRGQTFCRKNPDLHVPQAGQVSLNEVGARQGWFLGLSPRGKIIIYKILSFFPVNTGPNRSSGNQLSQKQPILKWKIAGSKPGW